MLLFLSFLEAVLFFTSTAVLYSHEITSAETNSPSLAVICLLAFSMGSQQIWARDIGVPEVTVTVLTNVGSQTSMKAAIELTALECKKASAQLMADPKLFVPLGKNNSRNIRAVFIIIFFFGSIVGGLMLNYVNFATALLLSSILKLIAPILFLILPNKRIEKEADQEIT